MTARDVLAAIEARLAVLPAEKWHVDGTCVAVETGGCNCGAGTDAYGHERHCGLDLLAEIGHTETAEFIAGARQDVPALLAAVRAVLDLHRARRIYDDCGHRHPDAAEDGVTLVTDVGYVCEAGFEYEICRECCTDSEYQTEECAGHLRPCYPCPTVTAITAALDPSSPSAPTPGGGEAASEACRVIDVDGEPVRYHGTALSPEANEALGAVVLAAKAKFTAEHAADNAVTVEHAARVEHVGTWFKAACPCGYRSGGLFAARAAALAVAQTHVRHPVLEERAREYERAGLADPVGGVL